MTIRGGLDYIAAAQRKDGGFWEYCLDESYQNHLKKYRTCFTPSLIALALQDVPGSESIKTQCAHFLLTQKSSAWSWNYWARMSVQSRVLPYPDDLDDTFLALTALWREERRLFSPAVSAAIAHLLFTTEKQPGGPYRSWLVDEMADKAWRDIDVAVNANVGGFLALQDIELPGITAFIEERIENGRFVSPYYPSVLPLAYFLSSWYRGASMDTLRQHILMKQIEGRWETPHDTALAVTALLRLGYPAAKLREARGYIEKEQLSDGSWHAAPMCIGPGGRRSGAPSLTTAFCLEALVAYERAEETTTDSVSRRPRRYDPVVSQVKKSIAKLEYVDLKHHTEGVFSQIIARDIDRQIVRMPWMIAQALGVTLDKSLARNLAVASIWGWMAYTVYDDFLDNEGDPVYLPSAIFAHRQLLGVLRETLSDSSHFQQEIQTIMDRLDQANAWEMAHCRGKVENNHLLIPVLPDYGDYWQLADRSLGHMIAGLGVLYGAGVSHTSTKMEGLREFFHHYLVARQLNDDAHDWQQDLRQGQINAVAVRILRIWSGNHDLEAGIDLVADMETLQQIMWETIIDKVCEDIFYHLEAARGALARIHADSSVLEPLLSSLEGSARTALRTRDDALEFLEHL